MLLVAQLVLRGDKTAVGGLDNPTRYLEFLKSLGVEAKADLMTYKNHDGKIVESGYLFYLD